MRVWKLLAALVVAAAALTLLLYQLLPRVRSHAPIYDWECNQCHHKSRRSVATAAADVPVIECPKCKAKAAERIMHYQCRKCWNKYDLRGSKAILANIVCPACGSRAARDLDHLIPGDDEPVEEGKPYPGK